MYTIYTERQGKKSYIFFRETGTFIWERRISGSKRHKSRSKMNDIYYLGRRLNTAQYVRCAWGSCD